MNNLLEKTLRDSKALDTQSLCIVPGKLAWKVIIDVNIINNDGNLFDACMLSCLASWLSYKIPFLRKSSNQINITKNIKMINLSTLHIPLSVTFGLFDNNQRYLIDPLLKEEKCIDGIVVISANKFNEICYLHTYGSIKVERETINQLIYITKEKIFSLIKTLKEFVEKQKMLIGNNSNKGDNDKMLIDEDLSDNMCYLGKLPKSEQIPLKKNKINLYEIK